MWVVKKHMKVAEELGLKWKLNVDVPMFAVSNEEEMAWWGFALVLNVCRVDETSFSCSFFLLSVGEQSARSLLLRNL